MKIKSSSCTLFAAVAATLLSIGTLTAKDVWSVDASRASLQIKCNGTTVVANSNFTIKAQSQFDREDLVINHCQTADGQAWNAISKSTPSPFRQEVFVNKDGSEVEVTFQTAAKAYEFEQETIHAYELRIPFELVSGMKYEAILDRAQRTKRVEGIIAPDTKVHLQKLQFRYLALSDGKDRNWVFDFNPNGVGNSTVSDYQLNNFRGMWGVHRDGKDLVMTIGWRVNFFGASQQTKVKIFSGSMRDYDKRHAFRSYSYPQAWAPIKLYSFGAKKAGDNYKMLNDRLYNGAEKAGWDNDVKLTAHNFAETGALYSAMSGKDGEFKFGKLPNGVYMLSIHAGNYGGIKNNFSLEVNDKNICKNISVAPRQAAFINVPVRVTDGEIEIEFNGNFIVSAIGLQFLLADAEDHSIFRGFWKSEDFEPGVLFNNAHYRTAPEFANSLQMIPMPPPEGTENKNPRQAEKLTAQPQGNLDWRYSAQILEFASGSANLSEYDTPERLNRRMEELKKNKINTIMVSGLHSRHTYPAHKERVLKYLKQLVEAAHKHNIKVIDHEDYNMLWNMDSGFRVLTTLTPALQHGLKEHMVSTHICPLNPEYRQKFYDYVAHQVKYTQLDGIMIDEMNFWPHSCGCLYCREAFKRDTGYELPMNELSNDWNNHQSALWKSFMQWRQTTIGNWWVELRKAVNQVRPECSFVTYTTHYGLNGNYASQGQGSNFFDIARGCDFLGTEIMSRNILQSARSVYPFRKAKNIFKILYNSPVFGLVYPEGDYDLAYFGWAMNNMLGQSSWEMIVPRPEGRRDYHFIAENIDRKNASMVADIALVFPVKSRENNPNLGMTGELYGAAQTLDSMKEPYVIINEECLTDEILKNYKVLYVGAAQCLSNEDISQLKKFAANGGTLYITTCTGIGYPNGFERDKWAFADVMDCAVNTRAIRCSTVKNPATGEDFTPKKRPIVYRWSKMPDPASVRATYGDADGKYPMLVEKPCGKGRIFYQNMGIGTWLAAPEGTPGYAWNFELDEKQDQLFKAIWNMVLGKERSFVLDAPEKVYFNITRQDNGKSTAVHLLNGTGSNVKTGEKIRSGAPDPAFPTVKGGVKFAIKLPAECSEVYAVSPDFDGRKPLKFRREANGMIAVEVPEEAFNVYTIVWLKNK